MATKITTPIFALLFVLVPPGASHAESGTEKTPAEKAAEFKDYQPYSVDGQSGSMDAGGTTLDRSFFTDGLSDGEKETQSNFSDTEDTYGDGEAITAHGQSTAQRLKANNPNTAQGIGYNIVTDSMSSPDGVLDVKTEICRVKRNTDKITIDDSVFPPMVEEDHIDMSCEGLDPNNIAPCPAGTEHQKEAERCYAEPDISCPEGGEYDYAAQKCFTDAKLGETEDVRIPNDQFAEGDEPAGATLIGNDSGSPGWETRMNHKTCRKHGYAIGIETDAYNDYGSVNNYVSHGTEIGGFDNGLDSFLKSTEYTELRCGEAECPDGYFLPNKGADMQCSAEPTFTCPDGTNLSADKESCVQERKIDALDECRVDPTHPDYWKCHDARTHFEMWKDGTGVSVTIDDVEDHFQRLHLADNSWENGKICFEASLSAICQEDVQAAWAIQGGCEVDVVAEQECPPGSVYSEGEGCVSAPEERYECPEGLEYDRGSGECTGEGELYLSCPDGYENQAVIGDKTIKGCFKEAEKAVSCPAGTQYTAPDRLGTGVCAAEAEFTPVCPDGTTYDGDGHCTTGVDYIPNCESDETYSGHYDGNGECYKDPGVEKYCYAQAEKEGDICVRDLYETTGYAGWIGMSDSCSNIGSYSFKASACKGSAQDYVEDRYPIVENWKGGDLRVTKECSGSDLHYKTEERGYSKDTRFTCEYDVERCPYGYEYKNGRCEDEVNKRPHCPWDGYELRDGWEYLPDGSWEYFSGAECASDPDYTLECPEGMEVDGAKCVTEADFIPNCPQGSSFVEEADEEVGCQADPEYSISCPDPNSERFLENEVPSPGNDYCETQDYDSRYVCADGTTLEDPAKTCPTYEPDFIQECPDGLELSERGMCVGAPELSADCPDGMSFDEEEGKCIADSEEDCLDPVTHRDPTAIAGEEFGDCETVTKEESVEVDSGRSEQEQSCVTGIDLEWDGCTATRDLRVDTQCEHGEYEEGDCVLDEPPRTPECPDGMTYQEGESDSGGMCVTEPETLLSCDSGWSLDESSGVCEKESEADDSICPGDAVFESDPPACVTDFGADPEYAAGYWWEVDAATACEINGYEYGGYTREVGYSGFLDFTVWEVYCYASACNDPFVEQGGECVYEPSDAELCEGGTYSEGTCETEPTETQQCEKGQPEEGRCVEEPDLVVDCPDGMEQDGQTCTGVPTYNIEGDSWQSETCKNAIAQTRNIVEGREDCSIAGYQNDWNGDSCIEVDGVEICPGSQLAEEIKGAHPEWTLSTSISYDHGKCENPEKSEECSDLAEECELVDTECAHSQMMPGVGAVCSDQRRTYNCPGESAEHKLVQRETLDCEGTMLECDEDTCVQQDGSDNEGFGEFVSQAQMAQTMENYMDCDDENNGCVLFDGEHKGCREAGSVFLGGNKEMANEFSGDYLGWTCCDLEKDQSKQNRLTEDRWYDLIAQWGSVMAKEVQENPGEAMAYYTGGWYYVGYKFVLDMGVAYYGRCEPEEMELADDKDREVAKFIGISCPVTMDDAVDEIDDYGGGGGEVMGNACVIEKNEYCVWSSPLEKMMAVEGRKQVGRDEYAETESVDLMGMFPDEEEVYEEEGREYEDQLLRIDPETIDCSGLTPEEAMSVDWSKIDDEKWMEALEKMRVEPDLDNVEPDQDELTAPTSYGGYQDTPSSIESDDTDAQQ